MRFSIDYGDGTRSRLTTFFRLILAIPIAVVVALLADTNSYLIGLQGATYTIPTLFLGILLMILFRKKYPRWVFDFLLEATRFAGRVGAYIGLLVDEYPSTDEHQSVHIDIVYPKAESDLNRFLPLIKWFLAIPHYVLLIFLGIAALVVTIIAWFAIIITGRYPEGMFRFVVGVSRWSYRVGGYAWYLVTDRYPPFRLSP